MRYFSEASKIVACLAFGHVLGVAAFLAFGHEVADADIGEGAPHHDFMVAAAAAVAVEVFGSLTPCSMRYWPAGVFVLEGACGGDMVGGDRVTEEGERTECLYSRASGCSCVKRSK